MSRKALGRGLKALIPDSQAPEGRSVLELDVDQIIPGRYQAREDFDQQGIADLARSITSCGIIQPVLVKQVDGDRYELIAGERRWRAARLAGLNTIPALLRQVGDPETLELGLIENLQREDLNPIEAARAYRQLIDKFDLTQESVASRVGKERSSVANHLRLLKLPPDIQEDLILGKLSMGHARALLSLHGKEKQLLARRTILSRGLSVREAERLVKKLAGPKITPRRKKAVKDLFIKELEGQLRRSLGTKVSIRPGAKGGSIEIQYFSTSELERLAEHISGGEMV